MVHFANKVITLHCTVNGGKKLVATRHNYRGLNFFKDLQNTAADSAMM